MTNTLRLAALTALAVGFAGTAQAQDGPGGRPDPLGDATITRADAEKKAGDQFDTLDANHDASLSPDEMKAMMPGGGRGGRFAEMMARRADTDGDGKISKAEFVAGAMQRFDMGDANHDGQLTKAERDAQRAAMRARFEGRGGPGGAGDMMHGMDGGPGPGGPGGSGGMGGDDDD